MAIVKTKVTGIERNGYDYIQAYAETQSSNSIIISELVYAYNLICKNINMAPVTFIEQLKNGEITPIMLAAYMNSVRTKNALFGINSGLSTPNFVLREISA